MVHNAQFCSIFTGVRVPRGDKETVLDRTYCRDNYNGRSFISVICFGRSGPLVVTSHDFVYATRPLLGLYARDKRASQLHGTSRVPVRRVKPPRLKLLHTFGKFSYGLAGD